MGRRSHEQKVRVARQASGKFPSVMQSFVGFRVSGRLKCSSQQGKTVTGPVLAAVLTKARARSRISAQAVDHANAYSLVSSQPTIDAVWLDHLVSVCVEDVSP